MKASITCHLGINTAKQMLSTKLAQRCRLSLLARAELCQTSCSTQNQIMASPIGQWGKNNRIDLTNNKCGLPAKGCGNEVPPSKPVVHHGTVGQWWIQKVAATATPHNQQGSIIFPCVHWENNNVINPANNAMQCNSKIHQLACHKSGHQFAHSPERELPGSSFEVDGQPSRSQPGGVLGDPSTSEQLKWVGKVPHSHGVTHQGNVTAPGPRSPSLWSTEALGPLQTPLPPAEQSSTVSHVAAENGFFVFQGFSSSCSNGC